jgi:hypothetical protein
MINNLRQRLADFQCLGQAEQQVLIDEAVLSQKKLADLESAIPALIESSTEQQETFAQSVDAVLANVQFPLAVAEAHSRSVGFFRDLVAWSSEGGSEVAIESSASEKIALLKSNYTMESERQAHAAALQAAPAMPNGTVFQPAVEMFEEFEPESSAVTGSLSVMAPVIEQIEEQLRPAELLAGGTIPPEQPNPSASEKPAASGGLGDNVELF